MPGFLGKKLCPQLTIVSPDFVKYAEVSRTVRRILVEYCDGGASGMVTMSLDEAYLNITQHLNDRADWPKDRRTYWPRAAPKTPMLVCRCSKTSNDPLLTDLLATSSASNSPTKQPTPGANTTNCPSHIVPLVVGKDEELATCLICGLLVKSGPRVFGTSAEEAVRELRFRVFCATRLTCSAGIAPNSLIAKIASDLNKPNGQFAVERTAEEVDAAISPLPIRKVPGIGHVTECRLRAFGVQTVHDLYLRRGILFHLVSPTALKYYMRITLGHSEDDWLDPDSNAASGDPQNACQKSMSIERTFQDCDDRQILQSKCKQLCFSLATEMKEAHVQGKTVTMKFKLDTFEIRSRSQTLSDYTCAATMIYQCASEILKTEIKSELTTNARNLTLRLMGTVAVSLISHLNHPQLMSL
uniref:DNA-directed DNA polymerase n=1 Tax=Mesocestoides corti TaxID=53468 RepID=A0A5K3FU39_MESCO